MSSSSSLGCNRILQGSRVVALGKNTTKAIGRCAPPRPKVCDAAGSRPGSCVVVFFWGKLSRREYARSATGIECSLTFGSGRSDHTHGFAPLLRAAQGHEAPARVKADDIGKRDDGSTGGPAGVPVGANAPDGDDAGGGLSGDGEHS